MKKIKDLEFFKEAVEGMATHQDLDSGELVHIDNGVFVLIAGEWIQEEESKIRNLKALG